MVSCSRCSHDNGVDHNFCVSCGAPLSNLIDEPTEMLILGDVGERAMEGETLGFLVSHGPKAGSRYKLDIGVTSLGRHPESTIFLNDITVSRRHAEAEFDGRTVTVRDVGSLNGTYLNRKQLDSPTEIIDGDVFQIGKFKLRFFRGTG